MSQAQCQVIFAPSNKAPRGDKTVFLAGSTNKVEEGDWRERLTTSLSELPITIYNPHRTDWDSSWRESVDFMPYREQTEWELNKQDEADIVAFYFHPETMAAVSLLELGLCARVPGKAVVLCPEGYWKRGNVHIVCERLGIEMVDGVDGLRAAIVKRLSNGL